MLVENLLSVTSYAPYPAIRPPCVGPAALLPVTQTSPTPRQLVRLSIGRRRWARGLPLTRSVTTAAPGMNAREDSWSSGKGSWTVHALLVCSMFTNSSSHAFRLIIQSWYLAAFCSAERKGPRSP
jgi:hypothetical protein